MEGIAKRKEHPNSPEPEVAIIFRQPDSQSTEVDIEELAERLYRAKLEVRRTFVGDIFSNSILLEKETKKGAF